MTTDLASKSARCGIAAPGLRVFRIALAHPVRRVHTLARLLVFCLLSSGFIPLTVSAQSKEKTQNFDVPAGHANATLKQFSTQISEQLLFSVDAVNGAKTNAVKGRMTAREALDALLANTGLVADFDAKTGSFAVRKESEVEKNGGRAAPTVSSGRPEQPSEKTSGNLRADSRTESELVELSPFEVSSSRDVGYLARNTLGGTRLDTSLRDVASQVSVMTPEFLEDIAATTIEDAFRYSLNVENSDEFTTVLDSSSFNSFIRTEDNRSRVRGIGPSTMSQDFFQTNLKQDTYNSERVTLASGPNAILFSLGSPAGVTDTSVKRARLDRTSGSVSLRLDSEKSARTTFDVNVPVLKNRLAGRLVLLRDDENSHREPAGKLDERIFGTVTFRPFKNTELRLSYEDVTSDSFPPLPTVIQDQITPWLAAGKPLFDNRGLTPSSTAADTNNRINAAGQQNLFTRFGTTTFLIPAGQMNGASVANLQRWSGTVVTRGPTRPAPDNVSATLNDSTVFPFDVAYNGKTTGSSTDTSVVRATLEQTLLGSIYLQAAYNREKRLRTIRNFLGGLALLGADANLYLPDGVTPNPNVGRYYFQNTGSGAPQRNINQREDARLSATTEFNLEKRLRWLGRHRLMGVLTRNEVVSGNQTFNLRVIKPSAAAAAAGVAAGAGIASRVYVDNPRDPNSQGVYWVNLPFDSVQNYILPDGTSVGSFDYPDGPTGTNMSNQFVTGMQLAAQSTWWSDRIVTTFGWRRDHNRSVGYSLPAGPQASIKDLAAMPFPAYKLDQSGNTTTSGVVVHPFKWLSLHFNRSGTFATGTTGTNPYGQVFPGAHGKGQDYGFTLSPFGERVYFRVNFYENTDGPRTNEAYDGPVYNAARTIEYSVLAAGAPPHPTYNPDLPYNLVGYSRSTGMEMELIANPTPDWRVSVNAAKSSAVSWEIGRDWLSFIREHTAVWAKYADAPAYNDPTRTVRDLYSSLSNTLTLMQATDGRRVESAREWRVNVVTRYSFRGGWLKNVFVGGTGQWRSANVVGYRTHGIPNGFPFPGLGGTVIASDIEQPMSGDPIITLDAFAGYSRKIFRDRIDWRVQLNIRNLLGDRSRIVQQVYSNGDVRQFNLPKPRQFILTNTFSF